MRSTSYRFWVIKLDPEAVLSIRPLVLLLLKLLLRRVAKITKCQRNKQSKCLDKKQTECNQNVPGLWKCSQSNPDKKRNNMKQSRNNYNEDTDHWTARLLMNVWRRHTCNVDSLWEVKHLTKNCSLLTYFFNRSNGGRLASSSAVSESNRSLIWSVEQRWPHKGQYIPDTRQRLYLHDTRTIPETRKEMPLVKHWD